MATRTISTELALTGEKAFNDAMKGVNNNLKNLRSDMALVSEEFAENADSMEALTKKEDILRQSVDQHRAKVDALRAMYEKQKTASGENSAAADKYRQQLNQATVALIKEERNLKKTSEALEAQKAAAEEAAKAEEDLGDASKKAAPKIEEAAEAVEEVAEKAERAESKLPAVAQGVGSIAGAAVKLGAAAATAATGLGTAAVVAMASFAKEAAESAKAAQEAGQTLTEEQKIWLSYAGTLSRLDDSAAKAKSALGGMLLPTLDKLSAKGTRYLNNFAFSMKLAGDDASKQADVISRYAAKGVEILLESLPEYIELGKTLVGGVLQGFGSSGAVEELAETGIDLVFDLLESILDAAPELGAAAEGLLKILLTSLSSRGPDMIITAVDLIGQLVDGLIENAEDIIPVAGTLILTLASALIEKIPDAFETLAEVIVKIGQYLTDPENLKEIATAAIDIGEALVNGIWDGVTKFWNILSDGLPWLASALSQAATNTVLGSSSFGSAGYIPGAASGLDYVPYDNYLVRLHRGEKVLTSAEADAYRKGQTNQTTKIVNVTINTQSLSNEELDSIVDYVNEKLGDDL